MTTGATEKSLHSLLHVDYFFPYIFWFLALHEYYETYILFLPSTNTLFIHCVYTLVNIIQGLFQDFAQGEEINPVIGVETDTFDKNVHSFKAY